MRACVRVCEEKRRARVSLHVHPGEDVGGGLADGDDESHELGGVLEQVAVLLDRRVVPRARNERGTGGELERGRRIRERERTRAWVYGRVSLCT